MANSIGGTNLFNAIGTGLEGSLTNNAGDWVLVRSTSGAIPSATAGYAIGCELQNATTGSLYVNIGTATSCNFRVVFGP